MLVRELELLKKVIKDHMKSFLVNRGEYMVNIPSGFTEEMLEIFDKEMDRFTHQQERK